MDSLDKTLDRLAMLPMFRAERPATDAEIAHIERALHVGLPDQYVRFLKRYGYAGGFGQKILGIRPTDPVTGEPSTVTSDVISRSERERRNPYGTASLPGDLVVIATDGAGGNFVLFGRGSPNEGEVHWYSFEDMPSPIRVWKTFEEFLEYEIGNAERRG